MQSQCKDANTLKCIFVKVENIQLKKNKNNQEELKNNRTALIIYLPQSVLLDGTEQFVLYIFQT